MHLNEPINQDRPHFLVDVLLPLHVCGRDHIIVSRVALRVSQPVEYLCCELGTSLRILNVARVDGVYLSFHLLHDLLFEGLESFLFRILQCHSGKQTILLGAHLCINSRWLLHLLVLFVIVCAVLLMTLNLISRLPLFTVHALRSSCCCLVRGVIGDAV